MAPSTLRCYVTTGACRCVTILKAIYLECVFISYQLCKKFLFAEMLLKFPVFIWVSKLRCNSHFTSGIAGPCVLYMTASERCFKIWVIDTKSVSIYHKTYYLEILPNFSASKTHKFVFRSRQLPIFRHNWSLFVSS